MFKFKKHGELGLEFSESVEHMGKVADDLCILRGMH
ncbi:DUF1501 domain-containing protein [Akkermansiaceae bacterium]|nr:DUF1501 domain-containing protein [Akkermansiaceae bacterium]